MANERNTDDNQAAIGCVMLALVIFGGAVIIQVLHTIMYFVVIVGAVGGIGFLIYKANIYDQRTGNITAWAERTFDLNKREGPTALPSGKEEVLSLSQATDEENLTLKDLESVKREVELLHEER